jgi:hypothetical protein
MLSRHQHGVAQPAGLALAHIMDVGHLGNAAHLGQLGDLAPLLQVVLELERTVEMVFQAPLAPAGNDQEVRYAARHRFFHHVLDGGLVHQRQHLLGLSLGSREEARPQAGGRDHRLAHLMGHRTAFLPGA